MSAVLCWQMVAPWMPLLASPLLRLTHHAWVNTVHGAVLGGLFLALLALSLVALAQLRAPGLTETGQRRASVWLTRLLIASAVAGWVAVLTGSFVVDHWFSTGGASAAAVLRAHGDALWASGVLRTKEVASWASAAVASAAVAFWLRGGLARRARWTGLLLGAALLLGVGGGALGVLLTKLAPLQ